MPHISPATDSLIARRFTVGSLDQKIHNKTALQEELGWPEEPKRALVCFPAGMTDVLGGALLKEVLPGLLTLPIEMLILGKGSAAYGSLFTQLSKEHNHRIHIVPEKEEAVRKMYAAADMALFPATPKSMREVAICLQYGVVPIALHGASSLQDYNPVQETGNAFLFDAANKWQCFGALVRALETYKFPFDWRTIQKHCMETAK